MLESSRHHLSCASQPPCVSIPSRRRHLFAFLRPLTSPNKHRYQPILLPSWWNAVHLLRYFVVDDSEGLADVLQAADIAGSLSLIPNHWCYVSVHDSIVVVVHKVVLSSSLSPTVWYCHPSDRGGCVTCDWDWNRVLSTRVG
ncbi:unnamed protein product [Lactuca virosa]|uniref:Uncharacterized protein n=1 Tax=Lactuca virosa TaxID=75947 RepID=A0AAU9PDV2_9ASTR|nr:unnamed protein product [Lactuca virosa]